MEDAKTQLLDMGFTAAQIDLAINQTKSQDIAVLITFIENQQQGGVQNQEQPQGQSISNLVNQEDVAILISLGHSKNASEKSLIMTGNKGVELATKWIDEHKADQDFEEELLIIQQEGKKMSPEEAQMKARELQQKLREKRRKEEEQNAIEQERNRIQSGKQMTQARRDLEDLKKKQEADHLRRQREQDERDRLAMLEQLRRDKEARFGHAPQQAQVQKQQEKPKTPIEQFELGIKQIRMAQPPDLVPDKAFNSMNLISKILENIIKNPQEQKFRKISLTGKPFLEKIDGTFGAKNALDALGFVEDGANYVINSQDIQLLSKALDITNRELQSL
ncbi:hypothetical protein pb186bvf_009486 [Paramecium bursaria]